MHPAPQGPGACRRGRLRRPIRPRPSASACRSDHPWRAQPASSVEALLAYLRTVPPVDKEVPAPTFGPVGLMLMATGQIQLSATLLADHQKAHVAEPPQELPDAEFGKHLANVCSGCHRADLGGGLVPGGDPAWPAAANLTPHRDGLAGWTYEDFHRALLEGKSKDGRMLAAPMSQFPKIAAKMSEVELQALWAYLQTVAPTPDRQE